MYTYRLLTTPPIQQLCRTRSNQVAAPTKDLNILTAPEVPERPKVCCHISTFKLVSTGHYCYIKKHSTDQKVMLKKDYHHDQLCKYNWCKLRENTRIKIN